MYDLIKTYDYLAPNYLPIQFAVLSRGQGALLWDTNSNCYIDMIAGYSAVNQGHCHPRIFAAMYDQARKLSISPRAFYNDVLGNFAKKLCEVTGLDMVLPANGGAESVETAIKIARRWGYVVKNIPKNHASIITFSGNFHGRSSTIISFSDNKEYRENFNPFMQGFRTLPYGDFQAIENELATTANHCAVLVEPIQGEAGVIIPPKGWLKHIEQLCRKHNLLLIADEIQSGLGRCGEWFACEIEAVNPDLLIVGKSLGGGLLPISAVAGRREPMDLMQPGSHGSTFGGNPLAAAVAIEALNVIQDEDLVGRSRELGLHMEQRLRSIKSNAIKEIRCVGLWAGIEVDTNVTNAFNICAKLFENGVVTKEAHNSIRLSPPLVITKGQLDLALDTLEDVLKNA